MMPIIPTERSSMLVNSYSVNAKHDATGNTGRGVDEQDERSCECCGKPRHTKDTCQRIHGHPKRGHGRKRYGGARTQAHISETSHTGQPGEPNSSGGLSNEELQTLRLLMGRLEYPSIIAITSTPSSNLAHSGAWHGANDWLW